MNSAIRHGKWTSSEVYKLLALDRKGGMGKPAQTYIKAKGIERRLGRSLSNETNARETTWGKLVESYAFSKLDMSYKICSQETLTHPKYPFWVGSPDGERFLTVKACVEQKCPFTLLSFCTVIDAWNAGGIAAVREEHPDGEKWYQQCVSNSILTNATHAELIIFCPYQSELSEIRMLAQSAPAVDLHSYYWISNTYDNELPYLIEGGHYQNMNILRFEIPEQDKRILTMAVLEAEKILSPDLIIAEQIPGAILIS